MPRTQADRRMNWATGGLLGLALALVLGAACPGCRSGGRTATPDSAAAPAGAQGSAAAAADGGSGTRPRPEQASVESVRAIEEAQRLQAEGRFDEALALARRVAQAEPQAVLPLRVAAASLSATNKWPEVDEALTQALSIHEKHGSSMDDEALANVYASRALARLLTRREAEALADARLALTHHPQEPTALYVGLKVSLASGKLAEAKGFGERLVAVAPTDANAHALLGIALSQLGEQAAAANEVRRAKELGASGEALDAIERAGATPAR